MKVKLLTGDDVPYEELAPGIGLARVDGSSEARVALGWAARLGRVLEAKIISVHAVNADIVRPYVPHRLLLVVHASPRCRTVW